MKLVVKNIFRDKNDHVTVYEPGTILEVKDKDRAADLVRRGLCTEYKGKKAAAVTLGKDVSTEAEQPHVDEVGNTPAEGMETASEETEDGKP